MFTLTIQDNNGQVVTQVSFEQGAFVLGRLDSCDIVLASTSVSRQHAKLSVQNGRCYIEDLGSANGIIVDGQRVVGRRDLGTASQIHMGDFYLFLEYKRPGLSNEQRVLQTMFIPRDSDHHKLVRIHDNFAGEEFSLSEAENTIGRTDENFILLSDPSISRHHAHIIRDGETYLVMDLQSSNGSSHNGKKLTSLQALKEGDIVNFGNVSFIFVSGDTQVDPRTIPRQPDNNSNFAQIAGIGVLILLSLAVGGSIVFAIYKHKQDKQETTKQVISKNDPPKDPIKNKEAQLLAQANKAMDRQDWKTAITRFEDLITLKPGHEEAILLKKKSIRERDAAALLEEGESLIEKGKHEEAKAILEKVPAGTKVSDRAKTTLEHTNRTLAYNYQTDAAKLAKSKRKSDWKKAHKQYVRALTLTPKDDQVLKRLQKLEKKMKKKRVRFAAYKP